MAQRFRVRFFFQAEDGIRDGHVTGVQTCALPISALSVGEADAITPVDQPLVATIDCGPASLAAPQATGVGVVVARAFDRELRPLCPTRDRAPPALAS